MCDRVPSFRNSTDMSIKMLCRCSAQPWLRRPQIGSFQPNIGYEKVRRLAWKSPRHPFVPHFHIAPLNSPYFQRLFFFLIRCLLGTNVTLTRINFVRARIPSNGQGIMKLRESFVHRYVLPVQFLLALSPKLLTDSTGLELVRIDTA